MQRFRRLAALLLALAACEPAIEATPALPPAPPIESALFPPNDPLLLLTEGARYLPASTPLVVAVQRPASWIDGSALGIAAAEEPYDRAIEALTLWATGLRLRTGAEIAAAGLDAKGPWGMAWFDVEAEVQVVFGRALDHHKLEGALAAAGLALFQPNIHFVCDDESARWAVVRDAFVFFVHADSCATGLGTAMGLADIKADKGLGSGKRFRRHLERLSFGADAAAYIQPTGSWVDFVVGRLDRRLISGFGHDPEHDEDKKFARPWRKARAQAADVIEGVALGLAVNRDGVRIKAFVATRDKPAVDDGAAPRIPEGEPRFAFDGRLDPMLFRELFAFLGLHPVMAVRALSDLDFDVSKLLLQFDGRLRVSVHRDESDQERPRRAHDLGLPPMSFRIGLSDPEFTRAYFLDWFERRRAQPPRSTGSVVLSADERVLHVREEGGTRQRPRGLWLRIDGDELVIANRNDAQKQKPEAVDADPLIGALASIERPAGALVLDAELLENFTPHARTRHGFQSFASQKVIELQDRINGLNQRLALEQRTGETRLLTALGSTVLVARAVDDGMMFYGAQRLAENDLAVVLEHAIWTLSGLTDLSDTGKQIAELEAEFVKLTKR